MENSMKTKRYQIMINAILILVTLMIVLPFVLVFLSSLTDENVLIRNGYSFFPEKFSFYAYQYIIRQGDKILRAYGVTIIVTIVGTVLNIAMSALMAYPLSVKTAAPPGADLFYLFYHVVQRWSGAYLFDVCQLFSYQKYAVGVDHPESAAECEQCADDTELLYDQHSGCAV